MLSIKTYNTPKNHSNASIQYLSQWAQKNKRVAIPSGVSLSEKKEYYTKALNAWNRMTDEEKEMCFKKEQTDDNQSAWCKRFKKEIKKLGFTFPDLYEKYLYELANSDDKVITVINM